MKVTEYSPVGGEVLREQGTMILGISINNSYFKNGNLEKIIRFAKEHAKCIYIMIPDEPAVHTLVAQGRDEESARRIARTKSNNLENRCKRIIETLGLHDIEIIRWKALVGNLLYEEALIEITEAYQSDELLRDAVRATTKEVLQNGSAKEPTAESIDRGVQFLLAELAFITRANDILGGSNVGYVYHRTMPLMRDIFAGKFSFKPCIYSGFITAE